MEQCLKFIHKYEDILDKVKFVGINGGTLGFFTSFEKEEPRLYFRYDN